MSRAGARRRRYSAGRDAGTRQQDPRRCGPANSVAGTDELRAQPDSQGAPTHLENERRMVGRQGVEPVFDPGAIDPDATLADHARRGAARAGQARRDHDR